MNLADKALCALTNAGIDARRVANYIGACKAPYVVVQDAGEMADMGRWARKVGVVLHCFVPANQPAQMPALIHCVRIAMRTAPMLRHAGQGEETINDAFKAIAQTVQYVALCAK